LPEAANTAADARGNRRIAVGRHLGQRCCDHGLGL